MQQTDGPSRPGPPFTVIVCDPPWPFATYSAKGKGKSPERHYPCLTLPEIAALGPALAPHLAADAVLLLWVVDPLLPQGIKIGEAWGFSYKTVLFTWTKRTKSGKEHMGCGYYSRANPEMCLLFRRGRGKVPVRDHGVRQWIDAPVGRHSEKPEESYRRIERLFGDLPTIELFGRRERSGWLTLGLDVTGRDIHEDLRLLRKGAP